MRMAISIPPFCEFSDPRYLAEIAHEAEDLGWEGFFLWDHLVFSRDYYPNTSPWVAMSAIALRTQTLAIGPMVTPLARRRPWQVARESVALDLLSNGRLILGVGLGEPADLDFGAFGEESAAAARARQLDEGLAILTGLWSGEPFQFAGNYYHLDETRFLPRPRQTPRIPIWVAGMWPNAAPMRRAARWDGVFPVGRDHPLHPEDWSQIVTAIGQQRQTDGPYDFVCGGVTPGDDAGAGTTQVAAYAATGVTWWIEDISPWRFSGTWKSPWTPELTDLMLQRIRQGPPHL